MSTIKTDRDVIVNERVVLLRYRARVVERVSMSDVALSTIINALDRILEILDEMLLALETENENVNEEEK